MKYILLLLASTVGFAEGVQLEKKTQAQWVPGKLPWHDNDFFDRNNADQDYHVAKFGAARRGRPITNKMEKEAAEEAHKAANKRYYPFKFDGHSNDDTGTEYAINWECYGKPCPKKDVIPGDKRRFVS